MRRCCDGREFPPYASASRLAERLGSGLREQLRQMAGPAFTLPSVHRWARAVTASSAGRPKSRLTDGSSYADVYLHGPCTGR